jgi:transposase
MAARSQRTPLPKASRSDPKSKALREQGCLHRQPEKVNDPLFQGSDFFDPKDVVQVKYEMLRRVEADGHTVSEASSSFGFSRPSFYQARDSFTAEGLPGLVPKKRGPRGGHKVTEKILLFIEKARGGDATLGGRRLAELVLQRFDVTIHPRTIERALRQRSKKNGS